MQLEIEDREDVIGLTFAYIGVFYLFGLVWFMVQDVTKLPAYALLLIPIVLFQKGILKYNDILNEELNMRVNK